MALANLIHALSHTSLQLPHLGNTHVPQLNVGVVVQEDVERLNVSVQDLPPKIHHMQEK